MRSAQPLADLVKMMFGYDSDLCFLRVHPQEMLCDFRWRVILTHTFPQSQRQIHCAKTAPDGALWPSALPMTRSL